MIPEKKKYIPAAVTVARERSVSNIIDNAINILGEQIDKLALKSRQLSLDDKDVKNLRQYISALTELSKEEREREKSDELSKRLEKMTDAELLELAQQKLQKNT